MPAAPRVDVAGGGITFEVAAAGLDPGWIPARVWFHLRDFGADPRFQLIGDVWVAHIPRPPVARLEYLFVLAGPGGAEAMATDPGNPLRVRTVFGEHSVLELPGYTPPWWLDDAAEHGYVAAPVPGTGVTAGPRADDRIRRLPGALVTPAHSPEPVVDTSAQVAVTGALRVPADSVPSEPLPLVLVHDGPEYAELGGLLGYLATIARLDPALRARVLLLDPVDRDRSYSASPAYARALVGGMLPQVTTAMRTIGRPVGVGASLGGLAMVHAATLHPGAFAGVLSQSGSFFTPELDAQESGYRHYPRIVRFVAGIDAEPERLADLALALTCGTGEDNLDNNRDLVRRLARVGVITKLVENPDGHTYTGWRDSLDPSLRTLLARAWSAPA